MQLDSTYIMFHTGVTQLIGLRHRESGTLYLSELIDLSGKNIRSGTWSVPYGKLQVGLYLMTLRDAVDRMEQTRTAEHSATAPNIAEGLGSVSPLLDGNVPFSDITLALVCRSAKLVCISS